MLVTPGRSELMYTAHCTCRKSQFSAMFEIGSPFSSPWRRILFTSTICINLTVKSSSLLPAPASISTLGLMHTGGTGIAVTNRFSGLPAKSNSSQSSSGIALNNPCK